MFLVYFLKLTHLGNYFITILLDTLYRKKNITITYYVLVFSIAKLNY